MLKRCINCEGTNTDKYNAERHTDVYVEIWGCYDCETEWKIEFGSPIREEI